MSTPDRWTIDWARVSPARFVSERDPAPRASPARIRTGRLSPTLLGALAALLALLAVAGILLFARDKGTTRDGPAHRASARPKAVSGRLMKPAGTAFVVSGIRFNVIGHPQQSWTREARVTPPGAGRRWITVSSLIRNIDRRRVTVEQLRLRLQDATGKVYVADAVVGNHGSDLPPGATIPPGRLVHGQLAFRVPTAARAVSLLIDASPQRLLRVPIGG